MEWVEEEDRYRLRQVGEVWQIDHSWNDGQDIVNEPRTFVSGHEARVNLQDAMLTKAWETWPGMRIKRSEFEQDDDKKCIIFPSIHYVGFIGRGPDLFTALLDALENHNG